ncbi:agouti-signaling protein 2b isoform X2 [Electrophorus electricus]|uniref:agouti-signaling protein 2b isoform X2 n=1 Tax=Electrophorus electricus TaxID=8005 RepID=UPI0015CFD6E7|nr:agouti-signaling protein 2b isoform X2 [Electrophorus electricus]
MAGRYLLCICFLFLMVLSVVDATEGTDTRRKHENDVAKQSSPVTAWNQEKPKRIFARTRYLPPLGTHVQGPIPELLGEAHTPVRRCALLNESCLVNTPCCEPCASCHCRLFNTICHCWRLGACHKKT